MEDNSSCFVCRIMIEVMGGILRSVYKVWFRKKYLVYVNINYVLRSKELYIEIIFIGKC